MHNTVAVLMPVESVNHKGKTYAGSVEERGAGNPESKLAQRGKNKESGGRLRKVSAVLQISQGRFHFSPENLREIGTTPRKKKCGGGVNWALASGSLSGYP